MMKREKEEEKKTRLEIETEREAKKKSDASETLLLLFAHISVLCAKYVCDVYHVRDACFFICLSLICETRESSAHIRRTTWIVYNLYI